MKIYVLLRDGVPLGYALAAASHCSLWEVHHSPRDPKIYGAVHVRASLL